ncbi:DUF2142 domain-containing protein [Sphingomonas sp. CARO-RG-8B-R24-01]|uniref:DUF2142 domain-containing protein n=1 Tax=Sphingomonas sp. CARO-RG-8B-R24-01 TaxID=2914831 RepID=UPI001F55CD30|nr:DUF2142 domain-containing protein [Sphingomonas sp. CARO-RG-8B-R24-01]
MRLTEKSAWGLDRIYLLCCIPVILALAYILPPFQAPDEAAHFYRSIQLSHGDIRPVLVDNIYRQGAGGLVDADAVALVKTYCAFPNWRCPIMVRPSLSDLLKRSAMRNARQLTSFSNTVVYLPIAHLAPALGIAAARSFGFSPMAWLYAGRIANGALAVGITWLALGLLGGNRATLVVFAVATVPMVVSVMPTLSADAAVLSGSFLLLALCVRMFDDRRWHWWLWPLLVFAVSAAAAAKLAYLPLAFIPVGSALAARRSTMFIVATLAIAAVAIAATLAWSLTINDYVFPISQDPDVIPKMQIAFIRHHPLATLAVMGKSMFHVAPYALKTMLGNSLSDLKVHVPFWYLLASMVALASAVLSFGAYRLPMLFRAFVGIVVTGCATATFLFLYIQNSPVAGVDVAGYQGRYLLPILPFVALIIPYNRVSIMVAEPPARALTAVCGVVSVWAITVFLALRTWG